MENFWDQRYSQKEYVYGVNPNEYLKAKLPEISAGKILFPAEGEGRNAVYAASLGWEVMAFDSSKEGKRKAELLAFQNNVAIEYSITDVENVSYPEKYFDALVFSYAHFPAAIRTEYHRKLSSFLKIGGMLILEGFSTNHIENQKVNPKAGGPNDPTMLYDLDSLKSDFNGFEFIEAYETEIELHEGIYHHGIASVIRVLAKKSDS